MGWCARVRMVESLDMSLYSVHVQYNRNPVIRPEATACYLLLYASPAPSNPLKLISVRPQGTLPTQQQRNRTMAARTLVACILAICLVSAIFSVSAMPESLAAVRSRKLAQPFWTAAICTEPSSSGGTITCNAKQAPACCAPYGIPKRSCQSANPAPKAGQAVKCQGDFKAPACCPK